MRLQRGEAPQLFDLLASLDGSVRNTRLKVLAELGLLAREGRLAGVLAPSTLVQESRPPSPVAQPLEERTLVLEGVGRSGVGTAGDDGHELDALNLGDLDP